MFTGIVQATGRIASRRAGGRWRAHPRRRWFARPRRCRDRRQHRRHGCCLTVVEVGPALLAFDVSGETLRCTTGFDASRRVNLEKSLRLADRLGGHLLSGHVDGVGTVAAFAPAGTGPQGSWHLVIDAPATISRYIAPKGSIAVDGVSLTSNAVDGSRFTVNLIPHTLARHDARAARDRRRRESGSGSARALRRTDAHRLTTARLARYGNGIEPCYSRTAPRSCESRFATSRTIGP